MSFSQRLVTARGRFTQEEIAQQTDIARNTLARYENGSRTPDTEWLQKFCALTQVRADWLLFGQGEMRAQTEPSGGLDPNEFVLVPLYDVETDTQKPNAEQRVLAHMAFRRYWLGREGLHPEHLLCIRARGDTMLNTIRDGDMLLVDTSRQQVERDGVYVLRTASGLRVKRLQRLLEGGMRVGHDNRAYADETVADAQSLNILGQVVWKGGRL